VLGWDAAVFGLGSGLESVAGGVVATRSGIGATFVLDAAVVSPGAGAVLATACRTGPPVARP
jgi:predicted MFS family arabinose efflux permease